MSTRSILWTALAVAALATVGCESVMTPDPGQATMPAANAPGGPGGRGGRGGPVSPANLGAAMRDMNGMLQALKKEAADPAQAEQALKDLAQFERDVSIAKMQIPPQINSIADAKAKGDALTSYRALMSGLMKTALDLEDAVNAKKPDDVKKAIAQLEGIEKQGHTELKVGQD
jgi:hypothetical protein